MKKNSETPEETGLEQPCSGDEPAGESAAAECAQEAREVPGGRATDFVPLVAELNMEIDHLYGKLHGLDEALRESDDRARQLEKKGQVIAQLQGHIIEKSGEINQLKKDAEGLNQSLHYHAVRTSELLGEKQEAIGQLAEKVAERDQEIDRLNGHVEEKGLIINQLTEKVTQKGQEIANLCGDVEDREHTIDRLEGKLGELDAALKDSNERAVQLIEENQEQITRLEWKVKEKYKEITQLHGKIHDLGDELRGSEERAEQLLQEKVQVTADLKGQITEKDREITELNERAEERAQEIANLAGQVNEQAQTIIGLENQVSDLQNSLRATEERAEQQLEEKQQEIAGLHGQIQNINASLHASEERAAQQLTEKAQEITRLVADIEEKDQAIVQLHASAAEKDGAIIGLEESIQQLNLSLHSVEKQAAQQLEHKQQEITKLEWSVNDKNTEISQLHGNIHDLSAELSSSQEQAAQQLQAKSQETSQLMARVRKLEEEKRDDAERAEQELQGKLKLVSQLEAKVQHLDNALHDSEESAAQQLAEKAQVINEKSQAIGQLEKQLEEQEAAMNVSVENSALELQAKTQEISQLAERMEQKVQEVTGLHGKVRDLGAELDTSEARATKLVKEHNQVVNQLKAKLEQQATVIQDSAGHAKQQQEEYTQVISQLEAKLEQQATVIQDSAGHAKQQQEEYTQVISQLEAKLEQQADTISINTSKLAGELEEKQEIINQLSAQLEEKDQEVSDLTSKLHTVNAGLGESKARITWESKENAKLINQLKAQFNEQVVAMRDSSKRTAQELKEKDRIIAEKTQLISRLEEKVVEMEANSHTAADKAGLSNDKGNQIARPASETEEQSGMVSGPQEQVRSAETSCSSDAELKQKEREVIKLQGKEISQLQQQIQGMKVSMRESAERALLKKEEQENTESPAVNTGHNKIKILMEEKLKMLSTLDMLTGMMNRQHFMQVLDESVSAEHAENPDLSVLYILLENFRDIREKIGVSDSDMVLRDVAGIIQNCIGKSDIVARFGYYVFTVIHYSDDTMAVDEFAARMLQSLDKQVFNIGGHSIRVRASIGISEVSKNMHDAEGLIQRADLACEVARSSEGAKIYSHNAAVEEQFSPEHETESHHMVRKTLQDERFYLVYQPIVSLGEDRRQRYEALLRIVDEDGEVVLPSQFLEIATSMGLSDEIDIWVIDNALKKLAEIQHQNKDATFYIKVSGKTIADRELSLWLDAKLNEHQLQRENVVIEIAEAAVLEDMENSMAFVTAMHNLGCKVALEHYGASSPPQVLKRLPVDVLKVNGGLIAGLASNKENQVTVKTIIELARNLGMQCIAEQIEDTSVLALLLQYGIQLVQGNFVQIPSKNLDYNFEASITGEESGSFSV